MSVHVPKITVVESFRLAEGNLAEIHKVGREYSFFVTSTEEFEAPDLHLGLNKAQAYNLLANVIKLEVLDCDL